MNPPPRRRGGKVNKSFLFFTPICLVQHFALCIELEPDFETVGKFPMVTERLEDRTRVSKVYVALESWTQEMNSVSRCKVHFFVKTLQPETLETQTSTSTSGRLTFVCCVQLLTHRLDSLSCFTSPRPHSTSPTYLIFCSVTGWRNPPPDQASIFDGLGGQNREAASKCTLTTTNMAAHSPVDVEGVRCRPEADRDSWICKQKIEMNRECRSSAVSVNGNFE